MEVQFMPHSIVSAFLLHDLRLIAFKYHLLAVDFLE